MQGHAFYQSEGRKLLRQSTKKFKMSQGNSLETNNIRLFLGSVEINRPC